MRADTGMTMRLLNCQCAKCARMAGLHRNGMHTARTYLHETGLLSYVKERMVNNDEIPYDILKNATAAFLFYTSHHLDYYLDTGKDPEFCKNESILKLFNLMCKQMEVSFVAALTIKEIAESAAYAKMAPNTGKMVNKLRAAFTLFTVASDYRKDKARTRTIVDACSVVGIKDPEDILTITRAVDKGVSGGIHDSRIGHLNILMYYVYTCMNVTVDWSSDWVEALVLSVEKSVNTLVDNTYVEGLCEKNNIGVIVHRVISECMLNDVKPIEDKEFHSNCAMLPGNKGVGYGDHGDLFGQDCPKEAPRLIRLNKKEVEMIHSDAMMEFSPPRTGKKRKGKITLEKLMLPTEPLPAPGEWTLDTPENRRWVTQKVNRVHYV